MIHTNGGWGLGSGAQGPTGNTGPVGPAGATGPAGGGSQTLAQTLLLGNDTGSLPIISDTTISGGPAQSSIEATALLLDTANADQIALTADNIASAVGTATASGLGGADVRRTATAASGDAHADSSATSVGGTASSNNFAQALGTGVAEANTQVQANSGDASANNTVQSVSGNALGSSFVKTDDVNKLAGATRVAIAGFSNEFQATIAILAGQNDAASNVYVITPDGNANHTSEVFGTTAVAAASAQSAVGTADCTITATGAGGTAAIGPVADTTGSIIKMAGVVIAPPDAMLAASQMAFWFDDTNGAAKFNVKGKSADGTIVSTSIPLAHTNVLAFLDGLNPSDGQGWAYQVSSGRVIPVNRVIAGQSAIANLNLGTLTLLTDAITAIGTLQSKINTLLAELRTAGLLTT